MVKNLIIVIILIIPFFAFNQGVKKEKVMDKKATFYHNKFVNRKTSTGEKFDQKIYCSS